MKHYTIRFLFFCFLGLLSCQVRSDSEDLKKQNDSLLSYITTLEHKVSSLEEDKTKYFQEEKRTDDLTSERGDNQFSEAKEEWKRARNDESISVTWKLKVSLVFDKGYEVVCYLYTENEDYSPSCRVNLYETNTTVRSGDILIVNGNTFGVTDNGNIKLTVKSIKKIGFE